MLVALAECPTGLFWCGDTLALKTEYGNNEGRIDAYIVSSGEFFWGDAPQTIASQRSQMVLPVDTDLAEAALTIRAGNPDFRMRLEAAFGPILKAAFPDEHPVTRLQVAQALSEKAAAAVEGDGDPVAEAVEHAFRAGWTAYFVWACPLANLPMEGPDDLNDAWAKYALARKPLPTDQSVRASVVEECARVVENWNGDTRDGDTFHIAEAIRNLSREGE